MDVRSETTTGADGWLAIHIFYVANSRPLIKECVQPLVRQLWAEDLVHGYFFINYWLEGPHVRLRLRPASPAARAEVQARAEAAITAFLRARPALYELRSQFYVGMYNQLLELEFPPEERARHLDEHGLMRVRTNNTFSYEPYEPEYGKYGGPAGIELAEWHFRHSSDLVMEAVAAMNLHVRTVLLGVSAQLMMVMTTAFLREAPAVRDYLQRYHDFWRAAFTGTTFVRDAEYDQAEAATADRVRERFAELRRVCAEGEAADLPWLTGTWYEHSAELRERVVDLARGGRLVFAAWDGSGDEVVTDPAAALERLLSPYMHMTNNRLGVTLSDEAYLAQVLSRSLPEPAAAGAAAADGAGR